MNGRIWIGVGLIGLALLVWQRGRVGSAIDALGNVLTIGAPEPSPRVRALAQAIAKAEGFYIPGSIPQQRNNPGNLKLPHYGGDGIDTFPTPGEGWAALYKQLNLIKSGQSAVYSIGMSIAEMGAKWAPAGVENIAGAWARNVASLLGVPATTPLSQVFG